MPINNQQTMSLECTKTCLREPKQDLKQFGDFSLGEVAVAAVSRPGSNYSKAAEIEFRRREVVIQIEAVEAQKAVVEAQKAAVEAQRP